jgi:D-alanyl-D-alanine carboxypeptidase
VFHRGDEVFPLASVRKVLVLGAYADAVAEGTLAPTEEIPLAEVERWYWPGIDGNAHRDALDDLRKNGRLFERAGVTTLRLDDVAFAAIRWSDNSAADYLLERVGSERVERFVARRRLARQEPIAPTFGELLAWTTSDVATWERFTPKQRAERNWKEALATSGEAVRGRALPSGNELARFAACSSGGTPREWAGLFAELFAPGSTGPADELIRRHLEWPLAAYPQERSRFVHLGAKPGAIGGVRTEVVYIQPVGHAAMVAALFLRDVPADADTELGRSFLDQKFLVAMATDRRFFARVREAFAGTDEPSRPSRRRKD